MTLLPIVERELRVRARRRGGHWLRFGLALGAFLICLPQLLFSGPFGGPGSVGKGVFDWIVAAAFVLSCGACFLTVNTISSEDQEGTLGLLFLTRLNTLDVLLGKFGSAGLTGLCSLLAFVPVMLIPIFAGGVTGGEALRKGLALLATLPLALAVGLWASAGQHRSGVALQALGVMVLAILVPYWAWHFGPPESKGLGLVSPLVSIVAAGDVAYAAGPLWFWGSLFGAVGLAALALWGAARRLRRVAFREAKIVVSPTPGSAGAARSRWCPKQDEARPVAWLVRRQPGVQASFWTAALVSCVFHCVMMFWTIGRRGTTFSMFSTWALVWLPGLAFSAIHTALFAWGAARFFLEARRTAELEVLLTTPVGPGSLVADQWRGLRRLLRWPVLVMMVPVFLPLVLMLKGSYPSGSGSHAEYEFRYWVSIVLGTVSLLVQVTTVCWLGMWFGFRARTPGGAILRAVGLAVCVPYVLSFFSNVVLSLMLFHFLGLRRTWFDVVYFCLPSLVVMGANLWLILWARKRLLLAVAGRVPAYLGVGELFVEAGQTVAGALRRAHHWTPL